MFEKSHTLKDIANNLLSSKRGKALHEEVAEADFQVFLYIESCPNKNAEKAELA